LKINSSIQHLNLAGNDFFWESLFFSFHFFHCFFLNTNSPKKKTIDLETKRNSSEVNWRRKFHLSSLNSELFTRLSPRKWGTK
jgi:hypothetical protein